MIDTHAHLSKRLCDIKELPNIEAVVLAASDIEDSKENIEFGRQNPGKLFPAVGIHPQDTLLQSKFSIDEQLNILEEMVINNNITAIGECGLDFSPPPPGERERGIEEQEKIFKKQIELAVKHNKPLIIHTRKSFEETIDILKIYPEAFGVIHCYSGGKKRIQKVLELGNWYFGIDGNVTYEDGLVEVVKMIPKDRLLAETDSPFLTPAPHRGETNKPDYVEFVYKKIAEIWGLSFEETEKIIDGNARKLFNIGH
ncbi:MAG TPA: TatD family hydrolase [Patescibacteria group bacterium]